MVTIGIDVAEFPNQVKTQKIIERQVWNGKGQVLAIQQRYEGSTQFARKCFYFRVIYPLNGYI